MALDPITGVLDFGGKILDKIFPDKTQAAQAKAALAYAQVQGQLQEVQDEWSNLNAQIEVNKTEASSGSVFVAGARPAAMWVCVTGLGLQFVVSPLLTWGSTLAGHPVTLPPLDMGTLLTLLGGMLGLGAYRTVEKINGVARSSL